MNSDKPALTNATNGASLRAASRTYLVTGAAGFIGSHLSEALLDRGDQVVGIDAFTDYYPRANKESNLSRLRDRARFTFVEANLNVLALAPMVEASDGVFHLAGQPGVRGSFGDTFSTYLSDNVMVTQRVFETAGQAGKRVVYASSSSVYGNAESYPTTEQSPVRPVSPYGVTKLCCEHLAASYADVLGLDAIGMRYFTVYGPRQRPDMATERIARALHEGRRFEVFGSGEQSRDVTYVHDAVSATMALMDRAPGRGVYNIGGGSETSLREIIAHCERLTGRRLDVSYGAPADGDVKRTAADCSRIRQDVGWEPQTSLEDGLLSQLTRAAALAAAV
jgi:UDP-glucuronate 4-epimerase